MLKVNEIFYSIQGEGEYTGTPMTFIRLAECNLNCPFCDTRYDTFTEMEEEAILAEVQKNPTMYVLLTGGEPLLQDVKKLMKILSNDYLLHLETNGMFTVPADFDYTCVSPKNTQVLTYNLTMAESVKYLCGIDNWLDIIKYCSKFVTGRQYLQPLSKDKELTQQAIEFVKQHPEFNLSVQMHKYINVR
jgi:organic radical activating enzyme